MSASDTGAISYAIWLLFEAENGRLRDTRWIMIEPRMICNDLVDSVSMRQFMADFADESLGTLP